MATINCLVTNILQNIVFCVQQNKQTHTGLELESEGDKHIHILYGDFTHVINLTYIFIYPENLCV